MLTCSDRNTRGGKHKCTLNLISHHVCALAWWGGSLDRVRQPSHLESRGINTGHNQCQYCRRNTQQASSRVGTFIMDQVARRDASPLAGFGNRTQSDSVDRKVHKREDADRDLADVKMTAYVSKI